MTVARPTKESKEETKPRHSRLRLDRHDGLALLALLAGLFIVYSSILLIPYAYSDDYFWLDNILLKHWHIFPGLAAQGRPINALILQWVFRQSGGLGGLAWVRALTITEMAGLGWLFYIALVRCGWGRVNSCLLAGLGCTMPAFQVHTMWATSVPVPWSGICAVAAAILTGWSCDRWPGRWPGLIAAAILILIASSIYQPAAMLFWPVAALDSFSGRDEKFFRRIAIYTLVGFAGIFLGWLVYEYGIHKYPGWVRPNRNGMTLDLPGKFLGFIKYPLVDALSIAGIQTRPMLSIAMGVVITFGLLGHFRGSALHRAICLCISAALLPLAYLPVLIAKQELWDFRTHIALDWMVLVLLWLAASGYWRLLGRNGGIPRPLVAIATCGVAISAAYHVTALIAWPQSIEQSMLRLALAQPDAMAARQIIFIMPTIADTPAPYCRFEFGCPSTSHLWVPEAAVNLIRRQMGMESFRMPVKMVSDWTQKLPAGAVVIDMREMGIHE
ncbi:MAG TPA: hypothetical protein VL992_04970 [Tepidisphaeraceae bacterium]|nr:hypothetical protein [Tepidisphaeraceae bacterium]